MVWRRRTGWNAGDPRWRTQLLDTTDRPVTESVDQVEQWIIEQRDAHRAGQLSLSHRAGLVIRPSCANSPHARSHDVRTRTVPTDGNGWRKAAV